MTGCERCGKCCTEMMMRVPFQQRPTVEEHLKDRADIERFYELHGFEVLPSMAGEIILRIPAACRHLVTEGMEKYDPEHFPGQPAACGIYADRPEICRTFECPRCK